MVLVLVLMVHWFRCDLQKDKIKEVEEIVIGFDFTSELLNLKLFQRDIFTFL